MDNATLLDQSVEDRVIRAVLEYPKLLELIVDSFTEENFGTRPKGKLWNSIVYYFREFHSMPTRDLLEITIEEMYPGNDQSIILRLVDKIYKLPAPEWGWIVKKIDEYIYTIKLQKAMFTCSELLQAGNLPDGEAALVGALRSQGIVRSGATNDLDMTQAEMFDIGSITESFCCPTRIYALDDVLRGLFRKELFLIMAPMNVGKSWAAVHMATSALFSGKHVLYMTLEMSRERVLQRVLQSVSGTYTPQFEGDMQKTVEIWDNSWGGKEKHVARSLLDAGLVYKNVGILKKFGGMLSVKEYPSGTASVKDIERDVELHDATFGKLPDVIVVDGLMDIHFAGSTDTHKQRLGLSQTARELRRLASVYNAAVVTTHQGNRDSIAAEVVGTQHTGESIGIVQVADTGISLNQTKAEHQMGMMRISIMRARNQSKWGMVNIWQNLTLGQFCQASEQTVDTSEEPGGTTKKTTAQARKKVRQPEEGDNDEESDE